MKWVILLRTSDDADRHWAAFHNWILSAAGNWDAFKRAEFQWAQENGRMESLLESRRALRLVAARKQGVESQRRSRRVLRWSLFWVLIVFALLVTLALSGQ